MPWLLRDGEVLAALEVADGFVPRLRGLLGRDGVQGALLLPRTRSVHTIGMRFPLDVAFLDGEHRVVSICCEVGRHRVVRPRTRGRHVLEAEAGAFGRWRLAVGDELEVRGWGEDGDPGPSPASGGAGAGDEPR